MAQSSQVLHAEPALRWALGLSIWSGLVVIAAVLVGRRMAGAFTESASDAVACAAVMFSLSAALLARVLYGSFQGERRGRKSVLRAGVATLVPPFAIGLALQPDPSTTAVTYLVGLFVLGAAGLLMGSEAPFARRSAEKIPERSDSADSNVQPFPSSLTATMESEEWCQASHPAPAFSSGSSRTEWTTRTPAGEHPEQMRGEATVRFQPGQQRAVVHLPFLPPFAEPPRVECRALTEAPIRAKIAAVYPYGCRIELRRGGTLEERLECPLEFTVTTEPAQAAAA